MSAHPQRMYESEIRITDFMIPRACLPVFKSHFYTFFHVTCFEHVTHDLYINFQSYYLSICLLHTISLTEFVHYEVYPTYMTVTNI